MVSLDVLSTWTEGSMIWSFRVVTRSQFWLVKVEFMPNPLKYLPTSMYHIDAIPLNIVFRREINYTSPSHPLQNRYREKANANPNLIMK